MCGTYPTSQFLRIPVGSTAPVAAPVALRGFRPQHRFLDLRLMAGARVEFLLAARLATLVVLSFSLFQPSPSCFRVVTQAQAQVPLLLVLCGFTP